MTIEYSSAWSGDNATSIAASSITNTSTATTGEISGNCASIEFGFQIVYGGTASQGVKAYLLHNSGSGWQDTADNPPSIELPYSISGTHDFSWTVTGLAAGKYKVHLTNNSGATVTATVNYRTSTVDSTDTSAATAGDIVANLVNAEVSVTGATSLTGSAFGSMHRCTGASAYTITLPAASGNGGKFIGFVFRPTSDAIVTVDGNGSETIGDVPLSRKYIAGESLILECNGTNWDVVSESLEQPYVHMELLSTQGSPNQAVTETWTLVRMDTTTIDTHGWWDGTNFRYTPKAPGKWVFTARAGVTIGDRFRVDTGIAKNADASPDLGGTLWTSSASDQTIRPVAVGPASLNGSSDYVDCRIWQNSGASEDVNGGSGGTYLIGWRETNIE